MIKINLLQEKKAKRAAAGEQSVVIGFGVVIALAAAVFFFVDSPLAAEVGELKQGNERLRRQIAQLQEETKDFDLIKQKLEAVRAQSLAIRRLNEARAVPAWLLRELSSILTKGRQPTMTPEMQERVKTDPNRRFNPSWDPKRVWMERFEEQDGRFTLVGGAQSDSDVTQLALRLQSSVFFEDVQLESAEHASNREMQFYRFVIRGKVRY